MTSLSQRQLRQDVRSLLDRMRILAELNIGRGLYCSQQSRYAIQQVLTVVMVFAIMFRNQIQSSSTPSDL